MSSFRAQRLSSPWIFLEANLTNLFPNLKHFWFLSLPVTPNSSGPPPSSVVFRPPQALAPRICLSPEHTLPHKSSLMQHLPAPYIPNACLMSLKRHGNLPHMGSFYSHWPYTKRKSPRPGPQELRSD